ncbi:hypothetical protein V5R04_05005 [Jonesiaceae bacterium BS-20]|uniref:Uncharacterized protein n=1 Tax=Jonesiaceae bacterium BS-20 TaxID=3120821 RepID=A0AAU7DXN3_9MICO
MSLPPSVPAPQGPVHRQEPATADKRKRLNIILAILLVLALAATGYLVFLARSWSNQSAELDAISSGLGTQIAGLQTELNATTDNLTVAQEQLTKAQKRITELASEKALVGDDRESQRIIAEDTAQVAQEALTVSSQLGDCISAQTAHANLITTAQGKQHEIISELLKENPNMDAIRSTNESLTEMNTDISTQRTAANDACTGAVDRYNRLLDDLNQQ